MLKSPMTGPPSQHIWIGLQDEDTDLCSSLGSNDIFSWQLPRDFKIRQVFLYYEESPVSSNLNSNLLWFHCAHPNLHTTL